MKEFKNIVITIDKNDLSKNEVVCLIELLANKININTISGMARSEKKTPSGIRTSKRYRKLRIGDALLCVEGLTDTNLPI